MGSRCAPKPSHGLGRLSRIGTGLTALLLLAGCDAPPPAALTQEAYVWQRTWTAPVGAAVRSRELDLDGLRVLGLHWVGDNAVATRLDLSALAARALPLRLVIRIEGSRPRIPSATVATAVREVLTEWQSQGLPVQGIEVDHDCGSGGLADYAAWLASLKAELPANLSLSITALPSWLDNPDALRALRGIADESVLQVHAVDARQAHLFNADNALNWVAAWQANAHSPFRVALPAYRLRVRSAANGKALVVAAEGPGELAGDAARERYAIPAEVARVVRELNQMRPSMLRGWLWFRLPVEGDRLGWAPTTLAYAMRGEMPMARIELLAVARGNGLFDLFLHNADQLDGLGPSVIAFPAHCGVLEGSGAFVTDPSTRRLQAEQAPWLSPDQRLAIGFTRCAQPLPAQQVLHASPTGSAAATTP